MPKPFKKAQCHPERKHLSRGLCKSCYDSWYAETNKEKVNKKKREWAKNNPQRVLAIQRKYKYGVSNEEVNSLLLEQNYRCAICQDSEPNHLDHNHISGKVRGILCSRCNQGVGFFRDSHSLLIKAIAYLMQEDLEKQMAVST